MLDTPDDLIDIIHILQPRLILFLHHFLILLHIISPSINIHSLHSYSFRSTQIIRMCSNDDTLGSIPLQATPTLSDNSPSQACTPRVVVMKTMRRTASLRSDTGQAVSVWYHSHEPRLRSLYHANAVVLERRLAMLVANARQLCIYL